MAASVITCIATLVLLAASQEAKVTKPHNGHRFEMSIVEQGAQYTEVIEVDPEAGVERVKVPAHNDIDGSTYIHHFPSKLTARVLDAFNTCYISDMRESASAEELSEPEDLIEAMESEEDYSDSDVLTEVNAWGVGGRVRYPEHLPGEFQKACKNYDIFWLVRVREEIAVTETEMNTEGNGTSIKVETTFSGQMAAASRHRRGLIEPLCSPHNLRARCKVERKTCSHYKRRYNMFRTCQLAPVANTRRNSNYCPKISHIIDTILCCRECCNVARQGDDFFPYCEAMPNFHCGLANEDAPKKW